MQKNIQDVVKILKSPGCRYVIRDEFTVFFSHCHRKTPVFVKSQEMAVELATCFATERSVITPIHTYV